MSNQRQMIGSISEYNYEQDDWNVYYERLEQFFEVNDVPEEKKSAFLISVIGAEAYKSLRDLCHPTLPKDKPFVDLCEFLRKQFTPQIAIFRERVKFYNARQENHENVTQWYGRLKRLSVDCKFGANLEGVLLDKFITGLRPGQVLDRLCEENETLKLEQALDIAVNKECAAKENAYLPSYRPFGVVQQPRLQQKCLFGGQPVASARLAVCPPAPSGYRPQAVGFDGAGQLFGGGGGGASGGASGGFGFGSSATALEAAPAALGAAPAVFGAAPAAFGASFNSAAPTIFAAAPAAGLAAAPAAKSTATLFGNTTADQVELEEVADSAPMLGGCALGSGNQQSQEQEQDGVPEGANRVGGPAAKGRRVRTRRRGGNRRGAAGDTGDKNSVDEEQQ